MAFSTEDRQLIATLAAGHNISESAVETLWQAVEAGNGTAAQFNHPELGGMGQWMAGSMAVVSDFNEAHMQETITQLCTTIATYLQNRAVAADYGVMDQRQTQSQWSNPGGIVPSNVVPPRPTTAQSISASSTTDQKRSTADAAQPNTQTATVRQSAGQQWWPDSLGLPNNSGSQNDMYYAYFAMHQRLALRIGNQVAIYDTGEHQISGISQRQSGTQNIGFRSPLGEVSLTQLKKLQEYEF